MVGVLAFLSLLMALPQPIFAQEYDVGNNLGFGLFFKGLIFDIKETIEFNPQKRAELKIQHANEIDADIQTRIKNNENIPQELVDLQKRKLDEAQKIVDEHAADIATDKSSIFEHVRTVLTEAFSKSEIRQVQADFAVLRSEQDPQKRAELARQLDEKVNKPSINRVCLGRIDSVAIANSENPYSALQDRCQILKLLPENQALRILD